MTGFGICLSKFHEDLNKPPVLHVPGRGIWQRCEYARVTQGTEYARIILNMLLRYSYNNIVTVTNVITLEFFYARFVNPVALQLWLLKWCKIQSLLLYVFSLYSIYSLFYSLVFLFISSLILFIFSLILFIFSLISYTFSLVLFTFSQIFNTFSLILFIFSQILKYIQSHLICIQSDLIYIQSHLNCIQSHLIYIKSHLICT